MPSDTFTNKRVTIMGLGLHGGGTEAARWFAGQGARVTVTDLRSRKQLRGSLRALKGLPITYCIGRHRTADFIHTDLIIKNPGVPHTSPFLRLARQHQIPVETDLSVFIKNVQNPIVGITGTKGKSTTTSLIYAILKKARRKPLMAGNIRISPLKILSKIKRNTPIILELSSWQLEDLSHISWSPHIAVLTNIMPDHLNRYRSMRTYVAAKSLIVKFQNKNDFLVANSDDRTVRKITRHVKSNIIWYSATNNPRCPVNIQNRTIYYKKSRIIRIDDITFPGVVNIGNILAAIAVSVTLGVSNICIKKALVAFTGVYGRMELVRKIGKLSFINDTTATTPDASISALSAFKGMIALIAGGSDKKLDYSGFAKSIKDSAVCVFMLPGAASEKLHTQLNKLGYKNIFSVHSMRQAVIRAFTYAKANKIDHILLSPGAASFGLFLNEFDRGDQFTAQVNKLSA